ncbi:hypothetical protein KAU19_05810, partial [Candidatus Parcubacteria bacterium]|nr:hypothetical protein [Candidatus Parcubacteria bacterium]
MLDYIKKFNNLSKELRDKVSAPVVMSAIEKLEKKYDVNLATVVMKIMVKEADANKLADYFTQEFKLDKTKAEQLIKELKEQILSGAADYLGIKKEVRNKQFPPKADETRAQEVRSDKAEEIAARQTAIAQSVKGLDFLFSDEDEAEIKELAKKMDSKAKSSLSDNEIEKQLDKTLAQAQINFGSEELAARFRKILKIYFRGIRDRIDTKQTLIKPMEAGGLSFDRESAEQVLKIINSNKMGKTPDITLPEKIKIPKLEKQKSEDLKKSGFASLSRSGVRDIDYDLASLSDKKSITSKEKIKEQDTGEALKRLDTEHELAPPPPKLPSASSEFQIDKSQDGQASLPSLKEESVVIESPFLPLSQEVKSEEASLAPSQIKEESVVIEPKPQTGKSEAEVEKKQEVKTRPVQEVKQIDDRKVDEATGKIKMEDVKAKFIRALGRDRGSGAEFRPKVMGPIDELKYMDLISFRRLDQNLVKIVEKIKEKINLLEEEDYAKRLKGIKAWRTSPVN